MADENFSTSEDQLSIEQYKQALDCILEMGNAIEALSVSIIEGDDSGYLNIAIMHLSKKISWTADRCLGFQQRNSDQWLISGTWAEHNQGKQTSKE